METFQDFYYEYRDEEKEFYSEFPDALPAYETFIDSFPVESLDFQIKKFPPDIQACIRARKKEEC